MNFDDLRSTLAGLEEKFDGLRRSAKRRLGLMDPLRIQPYRTYAGVDGFWLKGRVLEDEGIGEHDEQTVLTNARDAFKRYESDEMPGARVRVELEGAAHELETGEEGFFDLRLAPDQAPALTAPWTRLPLTLLAPLIDGQPPHRVHARVRCVDDSARLGVISDMDDTVIRTGADDFLKRLRVELTQGPASREAFAGVVPFYQALSEAERNPFFYVSSSAWNLYGLFEAFLDHHDIPPGPILLKEMGLSEKKWFKSGHDGYKRERVENVLAAFPDLEFILVGDSGQRDPWIYREVARDYPGRIRAIYIRDVSGEERDREVDALAEELAAEGTDLLRMPDCSVAAEHTCERGWLGGEAVDAVRASLQAA